MAEIDLAEEIPASADKVWDLLSDFGGLDRWMPGAGDIDVEGEGVGAVRTIPMGGASVKERLESLDREARRFSYSILEAPMPVKNYLTSVTVSELGSERCRVDWVTTFEAVGVPEEAIAQAIEKTYRKGLEAVAKAASG
jgi:carbon monoxide dehydrogenase subunit G